MLTLLQSRNVVALLLNAVSVSAQSPDWRPWGAPAIELPHEFTSITAVAELPDGRVLVLERGDGVVLIADFQSGEVKQLGRRGEGPGEYRLPANFLNLGGDSLGVVDGAEARILVVTASGNLGGFVALRAGRSTSGVGLAPRAHASDALGWFYSEGAAINRARDGAMIVVDSAPIVRWRIPGGSPDIVGYVERPHPPGTRAVGGGVVARPGVAVPTPQSRAIWTVGNDGTIAVISPEPYRVKLRRSSGEWTNGPEIPYRRIAVNDSVKRAYMAQQEPAGSVVFNRNTGEYTLRRTSGPVPEPALWAAELPPFVWNAFAGFQPDGTLWIQRATFAGPSRYDLLNARGELADRVFWPRGHRVIGFGRKNVFVVRTNSEGLEYLQRCDVPQRRG